MRRYLIMVPLPNPGNMIISKFKIHKVQYKQQNIIYLLCLDRCQITDIPRISVVLRNGKWVSSDNRRLWVFKNLERLGKCDQIEVNETYYIPSRKMTSRNGGVSIRIRGNPGGHWYLQPDATGSRTSFSASARYRENIRGFDSFARLRLLMLQMSLLENNLDRYNYGDYDFWQILRQLS